MFVVLALSCLSSVFCRSSCCRCSCGCGLLLLDAVPATMVVVVVLSVVVAGMTHIEGLNTLFSSLELTFIDINRLILVET